jgi:hypothetical protein
VYWPEIKEKNVETMGYGLVDQSVYFFKAEGEQDQIDILEVLPSFVYGKSPEEPIKEIIFQIEEKIENNDFDICQNYSKMHENIIPQEEEDNKKSLEFMNNYVFGYVDNSPKDMATQTYTVKEPEVKIQTPVVSKELDQLTKSESVNESDLYKRNQPIFK